MNKIVFKGYRQAFYFGWGLLAVSLIMFATFALRYNDIKFFLFSSALWSPLILFCQATVIKGLCYSIIDENIVNSYSYLNNYWCSVDMNKKVYYTFFFSYGEGKKIIAISNEEFEYKYKYIIVRFFQHYDKSKIIIMPYNDECVRLLSFKNSQYIVNTKEK